MQPTTAECSFSRLILRLVSISHAPAVLSADAENKTLTAAKHRTNNITAASRQEHLTDAESNNVRSVVVPRHF